MTSPDTVPSRAVATVLSLLWPGVGQAYAGRLRRAAFFVAAPIGALSLAALFARALVANHLSGVGIPIAVLALVWQVVAALDANKIPKAFLVPGPRARRLGITLAVWLARVALSVATSLAIRGYVVEAFKLPSGSMTPSIVVGDHVFVDKMRAGMRPNAGEPIVFQFPEHEEQDFIKRAIGFPGDTVRVDHGHAIINGFTLPSCFVGTVAMGREGTDPEQVDRPTDVFVEYHGASAYLIAIEKDESRDLAGGVAFEVKADEVFVLGDNRSNSHDSRMWFGGRGGGVRFEKIKGVPFVRWMTAPEKGVDWSRVGGDLSLPSLPREFAHLAPALATCLASRPSAASATAPAR